MQSQPFEPSDDARLKPPTYDELRRLHRFELATALRCLEAQLRVRASTVGASHEPFEMPADENRVALRRLELELDQLAGQAEVLSTIAAAKGNVPDAQLRDLANRAERASARECEIIMDAYWRDYGLAG